MVIEQDKLIQSPADKQTQTPKKKPKKLENSENQCLPKIINIQFTYTIPLKSFTTNKFDYINN